MPHVALATLFARAVRRAGMKPRPTDGFSPHAKLSFGPELPAGVVAFCEPVDLWVEEEAEKRTEDERTSMLNAQMPEGFRIRRCLVVPEDAPALSKACQAAHYWLWTREGCGSSVDALGDHVKRHFGEDVLSAEILEKNNEEEFVARISAVLANPAKNGIGGWVRALAAAGAVSGWQDLCIVRVALGRWERGRLFPLGLHPPMKEDVACLRTNTR